MDQSSGRRKENINTLAAGPSACVGNQRPALFPEHFPICFAPDLSPGGFFFAESAHFFSFFFFKENAQLVCKFFSKVILGF